MSPPSWIHADRAPPRRASSTADPHTARAAIWLPSTRARRRALAEVQAVGAIATPSTACSRSVARPARRIVPTRAEDLATQLATQTPVRGPLRHGRASHQALVLLDPARS